MTNLSMKQIVQNAEQAMFELRQASFAAGKAYSYGRFLYLWEIEMACDCEDAMGHLMKRFDEDYAKRPY